MEHNVKTPVLIACLLAASVAVAQDKSPADRDARAQARQAKAMEHFAAADTNRDGRLSVEEWQDVRMKKMAEAFARMDSNKDGSLTPAEIAQAHQARRGMRGHHRGAMQRMRALDTDGDRALSRSEIGDKMPRLSQNFDRLDSNRDGKLSHEEMREGRKALREQNR